jgi:undecaprenyl-diphosphatase
MSPFFAFFLGILEGLTEYLPVSSTGHLILASYALGLRGDAIGAFDIVIQLGAICAVLVHYRALLWTRSVGLFRRDPQSQRLLVALLLGFAPTALAGVFLRKHIKALLFGPRPVAFALVVGGLVMIAVELLRSHRGSRVPPSLAPTEGLDHVTPRRALLIGLGQCVSMWPGASRSMCTIVAGQLAGLSTATAAEFSFLLGLPTLGAATVYEAYKSRALLGELGAMQVALGLGASFIVAWAVIAAFLAYLKKRGLVPFGVYRILVGTAVFLLLSRA